MIGGGPAGLAAAIAARQRGFEVTLADAAMPPIDKACGEGIMPDGIAAAREVASGATLGHVAGLVWTELGIGICYAAAGFLLFRVLERESRRSAVLDAY